MSTRVAINGFGRIGRAVLRSAIERNAKLEIVAVHDVAPADVLAHLLSTIRSMGASPIPCEPRPERSSLPTGESRSSRTRARGFHGESSASTSSSRPPGGFARVQTLPATSRPAHAR